MERKQKTLEEQLDAILDEICRDVCMHNHLVHTCQMLEIMDEAEAEDYMSTVCRHCPMNKIK